MIEPLSFGAEFVARDRFGLEGRRGEGVRAIVETPAFVAARDAEIEHRVVADVPIDAEFGRAAMEIARQVSDEWIAWNLEGSRWKDEGFGEILIHMLALQRVPVAEGHVHGRRHVIRALRERGLGIRTNCRGRLSNERTRWRARHQRRWRLHQVSQCLIGIVEIVQPGYAFEISVVRLKIEFLRRFALKFLFNDAAELEFRGIRTD